MDRKGIVAEAALGELRSGQVVGLGTGSTANRFLDALAAALRDGRLRDVRGVPTSAQSEQRARELGITVVGFNQVRRVDVTVDGADEIAPGLDLIKGLGGALLREKIVAQNSDRVVIIADAPKVVPALATRSPLPVEVVPFGHETHATFLRGLGCTPTLRTDASGQPYVTDGGNHIYDCRFAASIGDPRTLQAKLRTRAGIVETGLFLGIASLALIARDGGVERREV